jgi:opacity protein-like surface antigen
MAPPTTLRRGGVELAIQQMYFTIEEHADAWNDTFAHPDAYHELGSDKNFPKLTLRAGVTDRIDIGAYYTENPNANYGWLGFDIRHGLLRQSETQAISLAVRGAYTRTLYVKDMDMNTFTAEVAAGRTFGNRLTPYLGAGGDLVLASETTDAVTLQSEEQFVPRAFGGLELRLWHILLGAEAEVGALNRFELKIGGGF